MEPGPPKILIVDDEPHVLHVVRYKLEGAGFGILTETNGKSAYETACEHKPALVVTDFQMPGIGGLELATRLSKNPDTAHIPLIMLTARGHLAPLAELAQTNVRCLLAKPFSPRNLLKKVSEILGQSRDAPREAGGEAGAEAA